MKRATLGVRDRRALLLGAVIAVPGVLVPLVVKPYLHALAAVREETTAERGRLAKERAAITELPAFPAIRRRASQQLGSEVNRLFQASDELVAAGDLAQYVTDVAQGSGVRLQRSETHPSHSVVPGVQALQVDVQVEGDLNGVLHFLQQLESGRKLVRIDGLSIGRGVQRGPWPGQRRWQRRGQEQELAAETRGGNDSEVLSFSASVYGYRLTLPPWSSTDTRGKGGASPFSRPTYAFESLDAIVDHDPFNATRSRPAVSYQMAMAGGTNASQAVQQAAAQLQKAKDNELLQGRKDIIVLGTVMSAGHDSFAMIGASPTLPVVSLRVGERLHTPLGDYTLVALRQGSAVFTTPHGDRFEKQLLEPGSSQ